MRVITINFNGIRSAAKKGFFDWVVTQNADIICVQETKAQMEHLDHSLYCPLPYSCHFADAEKKGYSGVGIYCKKEPDNLIRGLGWDCPDREGRYIQADFGELSLASLYMPSGTSGEERQTVKYAFLDRYLEVLKRIRQESRHYIICGDWNIAHKQIDLKNWRPNQKHSGFLPQERAWLDTLFDEVGMIDAFRVINQEPHQYTWWSNFANAWQNNVGWRIDYQIISPSLQDKVKSVSIYRDQKFSDHAPLIIDYDFEL
ncbi:MAG: exodeoxyribonuclease III [Gammaproteobacteria bacterium]|nr:exodeoxyribonuclease III [Gammaproteobacteria bacterium]